MTASTDQPRAIHTKRNAEKRRELIEHLARMMDVSADQAERGLDSLLAKGLVELVSEST